MSIEITLRHKTNVHAPLSFDLMDYIGNFGSLVDDIYQQLNADSPINVNDFEIIDTDYFNSFFEVSDFLTIPFAHNNYAKPFLAWCEMYNESFKNYSKFQQQFRGIFQEPKNFAEEYCEAELIHTPEWLLDFVDWQRVWDSKLSEEFKAIRVEDESMDSVSVYIYAIFQIPNSNS